MKKISFPDWTTKVLAALIVFGLFFGYIFWRTKSDESIEGEKQRIHDSLTEHFIYPAKTNEIARLIAQYEQSQKGRDIIDSLVEKFQPDSGGNDIDNGPPEH